MSKYSKRGEIELSELEKIKEKIKLVAEKYNLVYVWIFGSYAKKKQTKDSDVDIIVRTEDVISKYDLIIAEVSLPATGQGIELGWADYAKTSILCIYKKGVQISSSLKFITNDFIEYENDIDMINKIDNYINNKDIISK